MGYINSPSNVITIDTILTRRGRELLSAGQPLNITQFALADDEVDYSLWNTGHPSGSDYYGVAIENLPLIEAVPDESKIMKFKLVSLPAGTTVVPIISTAIPNVTFASVVNSTTAIGQDIKPFTQNGSNDTLGYQFTITNPEYFQFIQDVVPVAGVTNVSSAATSADWAAWYAGTGPNPRSSGMISTKGMKGKTLSIISNQIKLYPVVGSGAKAYYTSLAPNGLSAAVIAAAASARDMYVDTVISIAGRQTGGYTTVKVRINFGGTTS